MSKIGVELRPGEKRALLKVLDPKNIGFLRYRPLLLELQGVPQLDFFTVQAPELLRLARGLVESHDVEEADFKKLIDPTSAGMMSL